MPAKRTADKHKASVAKKARTNADPVQKKIQVVEDALKDESFLIPGPASNRDMLIDIAPAALKTPADQRHENQTAVIGMLKQACEAERVRRQARVDELQSEADAASDEKAVKVTAKEEEDAKLKAHREETEIKKTALEKAEEVVADSRDHLKQYTQAHSKAKAAHNELLEEQKNVLEVQQDSFKSLKEGSCYENPKDVKKHLGLLTTLLKGIDVEVALIKSLPGALGQQPSERGNFDEVAIKQVEEKLDAHIAELEEKVAAAQKKVSEEDGACIASEAVIDLAEEKKQACEKVIEEADEQEKVLMAALTAARAVVKEHTNVVKQRNSRLVDAQIARDDVVENVLPAIAFLEERVTPEPTTEDKEMQIDHAIEIPSPARGSAQLEPELVAA
jgi:hypothetical protein